MFRVWLLCSAVVLVSAQIPSIGFCPEYAPMADFDIESFLGKWYETERYFQFTEVTSRCVVTDYAKGPSGKIYVSNEVTSRLTGVKRVIDGTLELTGRGGDGKFTVKYSTTPISSQASLTVLDTDYDNYAVLWSCSGFGPVHTQSVWAMTRERLPPGNVLQKIYGVLDSYKISRNFFVKTDQEGCALAASDINAANGITVISTVVEATGLPQRKTPISGSGTSKRKSTDKNKLNVNKNMSTKSANDYDLGGEKSINGNLKVPEDIIPEPFMPQLIIPNEVVPESALLESVENQGILAEPDVVNTKAITPTDIVPELVVSGEVAPEHINSDVVQSVPFSSEPIRINIIETPVMGMADGAIQDIVNSVVRNSEASIQHELFQPLPENKQKPVQVAEIILQNNPIDSTEGNNNLLKTQIVPVIEHIAVVAPINEKSPDIAEIIEHGITPVKVGLHEKNILTEMKTN